MIEQNKKSKKYDTYLLMIGIAYVKLVETSDKDKRENYQKVIDTLYKAIKEID